MGDTIQTPPADCESIAAALHAARSGLTQIAPPRLSHGLSRLEDSQVIQDINTRRWLNEGRLMVGKKIGLTSKSVQSQLGVNEPDFGVLWADYAFPEGEPVPMSRFMQPRGEIEVAFVMERCIDDPDATMSQLIGAIAYAVPAIEIVDSAVADWDIRLVDTVADNASAGGFMLGTSPRSITGLDLRLGGAVLSCNGRPVSFGLGIACLGHPLNATLWLARRMASMGRPLESGDIILSGALGPLVPIKGGDVFTVEIQGFEPFHTIFEE